MSKKKDVIPKEGLVFKRILDMKYINEWNPLLDLKILLLTLLVILKKDGAM